MATRTSIAINSVGTISDPRIIGADGSTRVAHIGEKVFSREMIMTAANAAVHMQVEDRRPLYIGRARCPLCLSLSSELRRARSPLELPPPV